MKENRLKYKYIKSKNEVPVTVSFADVQYCSYNSFSFKYDKILSIRYTSNKFLPHSIHPGGGSLSSIFRSQSLQNRK